MREPDDIEVLELEFDEVNRSHLALHGVTDDDVIAVLENAPQFFLNLPGRGATHVMLGPDDSGRFFSIAIASTRVEGRWRPITGYRFSRRRALKYYTRGRP